MTIMSRQLTHTLQMLEDAPQSMLFGRRRRQVRRARASSRRPGRVTGEDNDENR